MVMPSQSHALARDELIRVLTAYKGYTTAPGAGDGSTLIDANLIGANDFVTSKTILIMFGNAIYETSRATVFNPATGAITVDPVFNAQIIAGTLFRILNIPAGSTLTALIVMLEANQYYDRVFYDSVTGIAGTAWPVGTPQVPSDVIADVITILAARNLHSIDVHGVLVLGVAMNHYCFIGHCHESIADTLDLNGQDVDDSRFDNCMITGAQAGAGLATYMQCILYNTSGIRGLLENCALFGTLAVATGDADFADFDHCTSVHGNIIVTIASPDRVSFKHFLGGMTLTAQAAGAVLVRGISGYLEVDAMVGGTLDIWAHGADIQINANCTAGTINIYGVANVTDNSAAGCVVTDYTVPYQIDRVQGGAETLESIDDELDAMLDLAGGEVLTLVMDGNEQILYEYPAAAAMPGAHPFFFAGLKIDWTGLNFGALEDTSIRVYEMVNGVNLRLISTEVFLAAALPVPVVTYHPRNAVTDIQPTPGYYRQGIRITAQQGAIGGGWNTLSYSRIDAVRGT